MFAREEYRVFPEIRQFLRKLFNKKDKDPPLVLTSKPVAVKDVLGRHDPKMGLILSLILHVVLVVTILGAGAYNRRNNKPKTSDEVFAVLPGHVSIYIPAMPKTGGGGGGGDRSPQPASKGSPPKFSLKQFTPPAVTIRNEQPKLAMEPSVVMPPELEQPAVNLNQLGDLLGKVLPPSNGPGFGGGIGNGNGGGVGSGTGPGIGSGFGGGTGGDVQGVGNGVNAPQLIKKVNPEYSDEARKAKLQGTVILYVEIDTEGNVRKVLINQKLGLGLDEKAAEAVKQWKFKPAAKNGVPVIVGVIIEVIFRLL